MPKGFPFITVIRAYCKVALVKYGRGQYKISFEYIFDLIKNHTKTVGQGFAVHPFYYIKKNQLFDFKQYTVG